MSNKDAESQMTANPIPEAVRVQFEAWAKAQGRSTNTWVESGEYSHYDTQRCWQAWQAAITAVQQPEPKDEARAAVDGEKLARLIREWELHDRTFGHDGRYPLIADFRALLPATQHQETKP